VLEDLVLIGSGAVVLERVVCRSPSLVGAGAVVSAGTEVPAGAMALGVPARIRPDTVTESLVAGNVTAYLKHLVQHRDGSREVRLADCLDA
jgi:carbonic anhydrase/acetyltransferase-like protein (isoleucine patch superfamily)